MVRIPFYSIIRILFCQFHYMNSIMQIFIIVWIPLCAFYHANSIVRFQLDNSIIEILIV